jgi:hypothetical protein
MKLVPVADGLVAVVRALADPEVAQALVVRVAVAQVAVVAQVVVPVVAVALAAMPTPTTDPSDPNVLQLTNNASNRSSFGNPNSNPNGWSWTSRFFVPSRTNLELAAGEPTSSRRQVIERGLPPVTA